MRAASTHNNIGSEVADAGAGFSKVGLLESTIAEKVSKKSPASFLEVPSINRPPT